MGFETSVHWKEKSEDKRNDDDEFSFLAKEEEEHE